MPGLFINAAAIFLGALVGRWSSFAASPSTQRQLRLVLTAITVWTGMAVIWTALPSSPAGAARRLLIALLALSIGSLAGHWLGLQRGWVRMLAWAGAGRPAPESGLAFESVVFGANPIGLAGAVLLGATGDWRPLALKAAMDALAAFGFSRAGSGTVAWSALPVLAVQGTLAGGASSLAWGLRDPDGTAAMATVCGLLTLVTAPVVLGVRRVPLANYLPALVLAPGLAAIWR